jgi:hypothetical protein
MHMHSLGIYTAIRAYDDAGVGTCTRGGSSGGADGAQGHTVATTIELLLELLLIFIGTKEMEGEL